MLVRIKPTCRAGSSILRRLCLSIFENIRHKAIKNALNVSALYQNIVPETGIEPVQPLRVTGF